MDTTRLFRRPPGDDEGFSLVEVIVSILVLTVALLALVPVQAKALGAVTAAAQRQQATAYAQQAVERVRARAATDAGFTAVSKGRRPDAGDAGVAACTSSCTLTLGNGAAEALRAPSNGTAPDSALLTWTSPDGRYTTRLYVIAPASASTVLVGLAAVTTWSAPSTGAAPRRVVVRTQVAAPVAVQS